MKRPKSSEQISGEIFALIDFNIVLIAELKKLQPNLPQNLLESFSLLPLPPEHYSPDHSSQDFLKGYSLVRECIRDTLRT